MKVSLRWIKQVALGIVVGASLLVGASAPALAQNHDRYDRYNRRNSGTTRRGGILGVIFGGNRNRRYDRHDRWDRHGRGRHQDRHRNRRYSRW